MNQVFRAGAEVAGSGVAEVCAQRAGAASIRTGSRMRSAMFIFSNRSPLFRNLKALSFRFGGGVGMKQ